MEEFLKIVEGSLSSTEVAIDGDKLKSYNTQLKMWDYAKVSAGNFQKPSFDDRSSILKKYYADISAKYSVGASKMFVFFWSNCGLILGCF